MVANQIKCSKREQRSNMEFLVVEKCKPYKIFRRTCDVYQEACFSEKIFTDGLNMTVRGAKTHRVSGKEKVPDAVVSKEGQ